MDNYNPRQPTRFRFKDSREMEKFIFINDEFNFIDEVIEEASKNKPWSKLVDAFKRGIAYKPILVFDSLEAALYIGSIENNNIYLSEISGDNVADISIEYNSTTDKLTITYVEDTLLASDNVKTLFGNQSIVGQGNIDLYVHHLIINTTSYFTIYSSNNLKVDTPEKLTLLLKDKDVYWFGVNQTQYIRNASLEFNTTNNLWQIRVDGESEFSPISDISDTVTTI